MYKIFALLFLLLPIFIMCSSQPNLGTRLRKDIRETVVPPKMIQFHVTSNIQFRYAHTLVTSIFDNSNNQTSQMVNFSVVIPNTAFISNFSMVIDGVEYIAEVKNKQEAENQYGVAVDGGQAAGLVAQRSSNKFTFSANLEPGKVVQFKLTYDELLQRKLGKYRQLINVNPGHVVEDFKIKVVIDESLPLLTLKVPELKQSNHVDSKPNQESKIAVIEKNIDPSKATIKFEPDEDYQLEAGEQGVHGQLEVEYEVDRKGQDSDIQVIDGYFVHYFTPENLPTLPKYTVFVLDISGSMFGEKMDQLKDAMFTILDDMNENDFFNILTFSTGVTPWIFHKRLGTENIKNINGQQQNRTSIQATKQNRDEAIKYIISLVASGRTNINDGLLQGLQTITRVNINEELPTHVQPLIVFLTDGLPSSGIMSRDLITANVKTANQHLNVPIYSLGFGRDADFNLIKQISEEASAFSRHIYEGSDAALQLENFFSQISSPVLANVRFNYVGGAVDNSSITDATVDTLFKGGEYIIAGQVNSGSTEEMQLIIIGDGKNGEKYEENIKICLRNSHNVSEIQNSAYMIRNQSMSTCSPSPSPASPDRSLAQNFLQKLHAFLNIKQLLKKTHITVNNSSLETSREKAARIAMDNNFVTELTSLIVVDPHNEPKIVEKSKTNFRPTYNSRIQVNSYMPTAGRYAGRSRSSSRYGSSRGRTRGYGGRSGRRRNSYPASESTGFSVFSDPRPQRPHWSPSTTAAPPLNNSTHCNITLYTKTYFRGENVIISSNTDDFQAINFDNKLVSMKVSGPCCWNLYTQNHFGGTEKIFSEGNFSSVTSVGPLFRQASSAKQIYCY